MQKTTTYTLKNTVNAHFVYLLPGRPDVQILVREDVINNTSYQSVTCFADGGRPQPQISWVVGSLPPSGYPFTVSVRESLPSNGLFNLSSVLRFPTHLQDEDNVTCVIQHPTLPHPKLATVRVKTYSECTFRAACVSFVEEGVSGCCFSSKRFAMKRHDSAACDAITFFCISFSLCSTCTLTEHKSHRTMQRIHVGMQAFCKVQ